MDGPYYAGDKNPNKPTENVPKNTTEKAAGNGNGNEVVAIDGPFADPDASPIPKRRVLILAEEEYLVSSDEELKNKPSTSKIAEQTMEREIRSNISVSDPKDGEEPILFLNSPSMASWGTDEDLLTQRLPQQLLHFSTNQRIKIL